MDPLITIILSLSLLNALLLAFLIIYGANDD